MSIIAVGLSASVRSESDCYTEHFTPYLEAIAVIIMILVLESKANIVLEKKSHFENFNSSFYCS